MTGPVRRTSRLFLLLFLFLSLARGGTVRAADSSPDQIRQTREAAEKGDAKSEFNLSMMMIDGRPGLPQDRPQAARWLEKSAGQGYAPAQRILGLSYMQNDDRDNALYWFQKAAAQGDKSAKREIERINAAAPDSLEVLTGKAEAGDPRAQYLLAARYADGRGGAEKSFPEARKWMQKAAEQGYADALEALKGLEK